MIFFYIFVYYYIKFDGFWKHLNFNSKSLIHNHIQSKYNQITLVEILIDWDKLQNYFEKYSWKFYLVQIIHNTKKKA